MENKKVTIIEHGNYLYGKLDSVDFTGSGVMINEQTNQKQAYGASLKLKLLIESIKMKNLNGVDIPIKSTVSQIVKIPTEDKELPALMAKYEALRGKDLLIHYFAGDNFSFKVLDEESIKEIK